MEYLQKAREAYEIKDYFDSIEMYSRVVAISQGEERLEALRKIAESYYRLQIFDKSLQRFEELCNLDYHQKDLFEIKNFIAIILGQKGLYEESMEKYKELLNLAENPSQKYKALVGLGLNNYFWVKKQTRNLFMVKQKNISKVL